ncbi:MAG: hypothetical protein JKY30_12315 [Flavobacteriales bacterium]|nr:hypothetical protein [Flavobacteriales bacterium]
MKFNLKYILIFALVVSCNLNNLDVTVEFKSHKISRFIETSEIDSINENWVKADSLFLSKLKEILKINERNIVDVLKVTKEDRRTKLGFGYEQIESSIGKGYVSIFYNIILKEGQIISYEFTPQLPKNKFLTERYKRLLSGIFKIDNDLIFNRYYNIEEMENPLRNLNSDVSLNENLRFLMTPFSGTRYGFSGGYDGGIFVNREIFINERKNITPEVCQVLMNSKNPGVRLMAVEYYLKNKSDFKNTTVFNSWIDKVYLELPIIETLDGCFVMPRNSEELVSEYVKRKN